MKSRILSVWCVAIAGCLFLAGLAAAQNGVILDQQLDGNNRGYTVLRIWGSHYQMGYAQANLLGDYIANGVDEMKDLVGEPDYSSLRLLMSAAVWKPLEIEDELDGMVASLAVTHPSAAIDKLRSRRWPPGGWISGRPRPHRTITCCLRGIPTTARRDGSTWPGPAPSPRGPA
jgi:hypothetical protein